MGDGRPMTEPASTLAGLWPMGLYFLAVLLMVIFTLGLSYLLGQRHKEKATGEAYESGMVPTGPGRTRPDVKFYLVAMLFVIFDLEAVFIFAWSVSLRELGWSGYIEIMVFIGILLAALVYLWRLGALDWGPRKFRRDM
jgi:NADH-quinone oxidoreductase subunit A